MENEVPGTLALAGRRTERRIAWLTLAFGGAASLGAIALHQGMWAAGLAIGTVLGWLNFRWLRRGLDALVLQSLAQSESKKPRVPVSTYLAIALRYVLIGGAVYVIFVYLHVPLASLICGLCALAAAAMAASVWEIAGPS